MRDLFALLILSMVILSCTKDKEDPVVVAPPVTDDCFVLPDYTEQLPNMDFESWGSPAVAGGKYEEPCGFVWTSGNGGSSFTGNLVCQRDTNPDGTYGVKMKTSKAFGVIAAGSLYTGVFKLNLNEPYKSAILGVPFSKKPKTFEGMYKYTSVNGDSAQILVLLTKYNTSTKKRDTVAHGILIEYQTINAYTPYSIALDYAYSAGTETPDSIAVSFTASKGSSTPELLGEVGSTLYVDQTKFIY